MTITSELRRRADEIAARLVLAAMERLAEQPTEAEPVPSPDPPARPNGAAPRPKCPECGKVVKPRRRGGPQKIYCSEKCRQRFHQRERRRRLADAAPPEPEPERVGQPELPPRRHRPMVTAEPEPQPADPKITQALSDIGRMPAETSIFGPASRAQPPSVPYAPEGSKAAQQRPRIA